MTGPQRALGYEVAMCTGLRAGELRSLTPDSFDLATGDVRLSAGDDKARRRRLQPLPAWLRDKLAAWLAAGGGLWGGFPEDWPGRLLQADLGCARRGWIGQAKDPGERAAREGSDVCRYEIAGPDGPLYWDFHSPRHWYITQVADLDGVSPSTLLALSRHVDPKLTLGIYAKARDSAGRDAVERIARPGGKKDGPAAPKEGAGAD
jgi:integrase